MTDALPSTPLATPHVDVLVCGGGPAGVAAAVAAARRGMSTALIESSGTLGGIWTAGALSWVIDAENKGGVMAEITRRLDDRGARLGDPRSEYTYDVEQMKLVLEEMCLSSGVHVRLLTHVTAALRDGGRVIGVSTESKSGAENWHATVVIDATGDGDVAASADCAFEIGHPDSGESQPMSLMAIVGGIDMAQVADCVSGGHAFINRGPADDFDRPKRALLAELMRAGRAPSYRGPTLFRIRDDTFALMANHEYGYSALDAADLTAATLHARAEIDEIVRALRSLGGRWASIHVQATADRIGVREGRRIAGVERVTRRDVLSGARWETAICHVEYPMDIHSLSAADGGYLSQRDGGSNLTGSPFDVPYGALVPRDVDGLLLAGRCISGDFWAHSSYRVTGNAVTIGEAAGVAAAVSVSSDVRPADVAWPELSRALVESRGTADGYRPAVQAPDTHQRAI